MPTLAAWLHDLSPFLIEFSRGVGLRWYGLSYAAGFIVGWLVLRTLARRGVTPLSEQRIADAMLTLIAGVVVGGRLGYVAFYDQSILTTFTPTFPWWGVLQLNHGGMASHGGMLGVVVATWFIARGPRDADGARPQRVPLLHVWDLTAVACTPGLFFGRLANFINGELLGRIVAPPGSPAPWWAVKFPQERFDWWNYAGPPDRARGLAPALSAEQSASLDRLLAQFTLPSDSDPSAAFERLLHAVRSAPAAVSGPLREQLAPLIAARHPSQLYQAVAEGIVVAGVLVLVWLRPRRPGVVGAAFLVAYGVLRVVTEFWRLPDSHLAVQRLMGLSRGQWLSVLMVVLGLVLLRVATASGRPLMGGLRRVGRTLPSGR